VAPASELETRIDFEEEYVKALALVPLVDHRFPFVVFDSGSWPNNRANNDPRAPWHFKLFPSFSPSPFCHATCHITCVVALCCTLPRFMF